MTENTKGAPGRAPIHTGAETSSQSDSSYYTPGSPELAMQALRQLLENLPPNMQEEIIKSWHKAVKRFTTMGNGWQDFILPLSTVDAVDLLNMELPPIPWIIPDYLGPGLCILGGRPKIGKSVLSLQLCAAVASGGYFLNKQAARGTVLYLALEDNNRRLQSRLACLQQDLLPGSLAFLNAKSFRDEIGPLNTGGSEILAHHIERGGYLLTIVDTLSRSVHGDHNDGPTMISALSPLQEYAIAANRVVLVVDHHTKPKGFSADPIDDILGHTAKTGVSDTIWGIYKERGVSGAKFAICGRDVEETTLEMSFDNENVCWMFVGEAGAVEASGLQNEILETLHTVGRATPRQISDALGRDWGARGSLYKVLKQLKATNSVIAEGDGGEIVYRLAKLA